MASLNALSVKWLSLLILVIQNSALILVMRYTRFSVEKDQLYLASTAVVMSEVLKTLICLVVLHQLVPSPLMSSSKLGYASLKRLALLLRREMLHSWRQSMKLGIPAVLYLIQNNLQYVAATHLDAATFQVTYQLKILTTAFFSVTMLQRSLSKRQWSALGTLTIGIALVMLPDNVEWSLWFTSSSVTIDNTQQHAATRYDYKGFLAVLMACTLSGLAGVYFEKLLKVTSPPTSSSPSLSSSSSSPSSLLSSSSTSSPLPYSILPTHKSQHPDDYELKKKVDDMNHTPLSTIPTQRQQQQQLWIRNMQMSFFSVILGLIFVVALQDGRLVMKNGFFAFYTKWTWCVIVIQACGGLIVALVVRYADNILKGFATSISIIISSVLSIWFFHVSLTFTFMVGASLVIFATYLYGLN